MTPYETESHFSEIFRPKIFRLTRIARSTDSEIPRHEGIEYLHIKIHDEPDEDIMSHIDNCHAFIGSNYLRFLAFCDSYPLFLNRNQCCTACNDPDSLQ